MNTKSKIAGIVLDWNVGAFPESTLSALNLEVIYGMSCSDK